MCGIFVVINHEETSFSLSDFRKSIDLIGHRGPDNSGYFSDDYCFMGHTRLSILDTNEHANQPFFYSDLVLVYNGEIFNYIELKEELISKGYTFDTTSDTEVVIKAFDKWGEECFEKFNGMWSLAIYNKNQKKVIVSRDRFGQKPLFILKRDDKSTFIGSEIQSLAPYSEYKINYHSIQSYLKEGNYQENHSETFFAFVHDFPKAMYVVFNSDKIEKTKQFWMYPSKSLKKVTKSTYSEFRDLFDNAVRIRLRTDVPYGILLSGGLDSTIVAEVAQKLKLNDEKVSAYTYSSEDKDDELKYAKIIAEQNSLSLNVATQDDNPNHYIQRLKKLVRHLGKGHSSPAIVSVDYLYELAKKGNTKVVLDGQGADELLSGYRTDYILRLYIALIRLNFKEAKAILMKIKDYGVKNNIVYFIRQVAPPSLRTVMRTMHGYEGFFRSVKKYNYNPFGQIKINKNKSLINRYWINYHNIGLENLLYYGDIIAMRHSVENRSPFLDHRLVDFVFEYSDDLTMRNGVEKYPLKTFPEFKKNEDILERPKIGFSSDIKKQTKELMVAQLKESPILEWPIFSQKFRNVINGNDLLQPKFERFLFRCFQVHLWNEIFIETNKGST